MNDGFSSRQEEFDIIDKPKYKGATFRMNVNLTDCYQARAPGIFQDVDKFLPGIFEATCILEGLDEMLFIIAS